jgi:hypothetical protein
MVVVVVIVTVVKVDSVTVVSVAVLEVQMPQVPGQSTGILYSPSGSASVQNLCSALLWHGTTGSGMPLHDGVVVVSVAVVVSVTVVSVTVVSVTVESVTVEPVVTVVPLTVDVVSTHVPHSTLHSLLTDGAMQSPTSASLQNGSGSGMPLQASVVVVAVMLVTVEPVTVESVPVVVEEVQTPHVPGHSPRMSIGGFDSVQYL